MKKYIIMAKKQIKLTEKDLKNIIKESVKRYLKENVDEISPEFLIHASHAADADKKKHPGRGKDSKDPEIRAKRDRQSKLFGSGAADRINAELGTDKFSVHGDRGARTLQMTMDKDSAYLRPDSDFPNTKLYNDDYVEGDEPRTMSNLGHEDYAEAEKIFNKFKGYHDRAKELDDKYLAEAVERAVSESVQRAIDEGIFGDSIKQIYKNYRDTDEELPTRRDWREWVRQDGTPSDYAFYKERYNKGKKDYAIDALDHMPGFKGKATRAIARPFGHAAANLGRGIRKADHWWNGKPE